MGRLIGSAFIVIARRATGLRFGFGAMACTIFAPRSISWRHQLTSCRWHSQLWDVVKCPAYRLVYLNSKVFVAVSAVGGTMLSSDFCGCQFYLSLCESKHGSVSGAQVDLFVFAVDSLLSGTWAARSRSAPCGATSTPCASTSTPPSSWTKPSTRWPTTAAKGKLLQLCKFTLIWSVLFARLC